MGQKFEVLDTVSDQAICWNNVMIPQFVVVDS